MSFEPIIETIVSDFNTKVENEIYSAVAETRVEVNKDELIKLLKGDRDSYLQGYQDGMNNENVISVDVVAEHIHKRFDSCYLCKEKETCTGADTDEVCIEATKERVRSWKDNENK